MNITVKCKKHPGYQAKRIPTSTCAVCRFIYKLVNAVHLLGYTERLQVRRISEILEETE
jgi:hypothetical protein